MKARYLSLRGLVYLGLEFQHIASIKDLYCIYPYEESSTREAMIELLKMDHGKPVDKFIADLHSRCLSFMDPEEDDEFCNMVRSVIDDYLIHVPRGFGRPLSEEAMITVARNSLVCDECGEVIPAGEAVFIRTDPVRAIRHKKCNAIVRYRKEYCVVDYQVREINRFEQMFSSKENCTYYLDKSNPYTDFIRMGFALDSNGAITKLPRFSDFVFDYISGRDDYSMMMEYRPYHVYLQFLLNLKGLSDIKIDAMLGYKYLLREEKGISRYPDLARSIEMTTYSDLFSYDPVYDVVDKNVKRVVYGALVSKILSVTGLLKDGAIFFNGSLLTYSVNCSDGSDLMITVDSNGIMCTDSETTVPLCDYFHLSIDMTPFYAYVKRFEA